MMIRRDLLSHIRRFSAEQECGAIIASHFTDGLDDICDYINFMSRGEFVLQDGKDDLLDQWNWIHFKEGSLSGSLEEQLVGIEKHPFHNSGLTRDFAEIRGQLATRISSGDIRVENANLDDILIALLKGETNDWPA